MGTTDDATTLNMDPDVSQIAQEANNSGMKYIIEATYDNATNEQTADELSAVLNQAYQSPLYRQGEGFRGEIAYMENGGYTFRR